MQIMFKSRLGLTPFFILLIAMLGFTTPLRADAPFIDSKAVKERFKEITAEDMEMLRSKKILFASRSFGLNLCNGLRLLTKEDSKYEMLSSYERYDVFKAGGDLSIIPADAFKNKNFIHFLATYWPHTKRMEEMDDLLRKAPHEFGKTADVVLVYFHTALPNNFDQYAEKMDAWRKDFPKIRFIYVTSAFMAKEKEKENEASHAFSEKLRAKYKGKVPIYDLGAILSDDFRDGHAYLPEYSKDPAGVHPSADLGQTMMAKGFLLVLRDTLKMKPDANDGGVNDSPKSDKPEPKVETIPATHPDYRAVQAILNANGLTKKKVESVSVVENGRIVKLYLQEGGIKVLPDSIGALTELRVLHLYGDRALKLPLLEKISPAIARCTKLEELLLNNNELKTLPKEIVGLKNLTTLSLADNPLSDLSPAVLEWVKKADPKWESKH